MARRFLVPVDLPGDAAAALHATTKQQVDAGLATKAAVTHAAAHAAGGADVVTPAAIGAQPVDADLTTIAALTATTDNFMVAAASAWASRTPAQAKTSLGLVKGDVGLGSVDNTSDAGKPVSTAQQTALNLKADLASPTFTGAVTTPRVVTPTVTLTDAATIAVDASTGNQFKVTLGGNRTLGSPTGSPVDGQKMMIAVRQDATGSRTLAYNAIYRFGSDVPSPVLTTTAAKTDYLGFLYNATDTKWDCVAVARGF